MSALATQEVVYKRPDVLYVDEDYSVKPPAYGSIEKLIQSLKNNGPLIAEGKMGPAAYTQDAFKLKDQFGDEDIYGWKRNTSKEYAPSASVVLLGARKIESGSYVYFTLASDITKGESLIRGYKPSETDIKTYVMSYENFLNRLVNLHPICPHGKWLFTAEISSFLKAEAQKCKEVGQQIFDHYKGLKGESEMGIEAMKRVCEAARVLSSDGTARCRTIETAWNRVGDETCRWQG